MEPNGDSLLLKSEDNVLESTIIRGALKKRPLVETLVIGCIVFLELALLSVLMALDEGPSATS